MPKMNARVQSQAAHWASPTGGWNSLQNIAEMQPTDAVRMDNLFPETSYVRLRRGSATWYSIGGTAPVRSLMTYSSVSGDRLMAATGGNIYDITTKASTSILSGSSSDVWEYVNFATPGGQYWVGVNGYGQQWTWPGSGTATAATNTHDASISTINPWSMITSFQSRLFFCSNADLILYYLPVNVFQGEVHGMDLGSLLTLGGQIAFLGTWTRDDSTLGMADLLVIGTNKGEVLTYRGVNPDDPSNWFLAGRFVCGKPVTGHRQLTRLGPDMMLINEDGFMGLSNYLAMGESKALTSQISMKIGNAVTQAILAAGSVPGWCAVLYPPKNILIVNVPIPGGNFQQYVVNTITGSWCRFTGLNAWCWTAFAGGLYFGANNGVVMQADVGGTDNGQPIAFDLVTSFQAFGDPRQKRAVMCRPFMIASGNWYPVMDVNVDYIIAPVTAALEVESTQTQWDQFDWDQADWGSVGTPQHDWYSVNGIGTAFALHFSGTAINSNLQLMALDMAYEQAVGFV